MCFNASLSQKAEILEKMFNAVFDISDFKKVYFKSAFSLPYWPVLKAEDSQNFKFLQWGLIPFWEKNIEMAEKIRFKTFNARFETLNEKPSYRHPADSKRCGIVVDGYFEWKEIDGKKYPYYLYMPDKSPFLMAGIWDRWVNMENKNIYETFSVVTTKAEGISAEVHNTKKRMPLILDNENISMWMDKDKRFKEINNRDGGRGKE
ncbi:MAG: SOS response-associated peptidase [Spirochaetia bacterium]|jgi:putative SOS response-associated peptidase YedK|nr:SOS response-associated peptidase [Spirochaetia bacterium]